MLDGVRAMAGAVLASWGNQLGGTFLLPGSTFSLGALAASLVLFVLLAVPVQRKVRLKVLRRALFPKRILTSASGRTDLAYFVGGILMSGLLIGWALFSAEQVRGFVQGWTGAPPALRVPHWLAAPIATLALYLAYEFAYWLDHWLMHRVPLFWHVHKVHHQAESLSLFTNGRVHPLETIGFANIVALCTGLTAVLLDQLLGHVDPWTIGGTNLLVMLFAVTVSHLQHSHLWLSFGPFWGRILLGPAHHQIHHSADPAHFNRNLGASLALFDRLFGTFHMPAAKRETLRFGVDDEETAPHGARAALVAPVTAIAGDIARGVRGRPGPLPAA